MGVISKTVILGGTVAIAVVAHAAFPLDGLTAIARQEIPSSMVDVYKAAALRCTGLPWQVLAAIGGVESSHAAGRIDPKTGDLPAPIEGPALDGKAGAARLPDKSQPDGWVHPLGPMGLLPAAWSRYAVLAPGRPAGAAPSVQNAWDAAYTTASELCGGTPLLNDLNLSIRNHSPRPTDVMGVLLRAARYGSGAVPDVAALVTAASGGVPAGSGSSGPAQAVLAAAASVLGTPYVWGEESPGAGFDCSGLVWWAYRQIGVNLPRTTEQQVLAGRALSTSDPLRPGDLLFMRGGQQVHDFGHVAIYAGNGLEIVAPRSGKSVTVQRVDLSKVQAARRILTA